jgi:exonuclease III
MKMVIIDWNCRQKFWDRYKIFLDDNLKWDILVIQECDCPEYVKEEHPDYYDWAISYQCKWVGDEWDKSQKIGIGIFAKDYIKIEDLRKIFKNESPINFDWSSIRTDMKSNELKYFLPVLVNDNFVLIGVYAKSPKIEDEILNKLNKNLNKKDENYKYKYHFQYMGQIKEYLEKDENKKYLRKEILDGKKCIVVGDFNENPSIKSVNKKFFKKTMDFIKNEIGLVSAYHLVNGNINFGEEKEPTRYDPQKKNDPYYKGDHIDYCMISGNLKDNLIPKISSEWIDENGVKKWKGKSDHCPLIIHI